MGFSEAVIDLNALGANLRAVRGLLQPGVALLAVVKANAYGHGSIEVSRALVAAGADVLSIAESRHTLEDVYLELVQDTEGRTR